jgi:GEVED domain/Ig-like domain CHU_C associated/Secretion system C-terminal sorting domain
MTNSYMTDPASNRKFLFARSPWVKSVSLTEAAAAVKAGMSRLLVVAMLVALGATSAFATTCATATAITPANLPIVSQSIVCGATNEVDYTAIASTAYQGSCVSSTYYGGYEAMYFFTPTSTGLYSISIAGQTYTSIFVFSGCPTTAGSTCVGGVTGSGSTKSVTVYLSSGTQYFIMFDTYPTPNSACPGTFSMSYITPNTVTAVAQGGLWNAATTWVGGVIPNAASTVTIPSTAIVSIDAVVSVSGLTVNGTLQHTAAANNLTVYGDMTVSATGKYYPHTSLHATMTTTLAIQGAFTNNGYCNFTNAGINFNGGPLSSANCTLTGTGTFQDGILRSLFFQSTGSHTISQTANLIVGTFGHTAGALTTNGKVTIDNTGVSQGGSWNTSVQAAYVTNMGATLSVPPVVFGTAVTPYANALAATANTRYYSGSNVYLCTTAGTFNATPPTSTASTTFTTSGPTLLYIGTLGTVGNPFQVTAVTAGTQYFYGNNLYTCTVAGTPTAATAPTHTSGTAASGTATFLYVGTVAKVSTNWDATNSMVRSLNITQAGSGYAQVAANPTCVFSIGAAGATGTLPSGAVLVPGAAAGTATNSSIQKSGSATITGTLPINSDGGASGLSADPQSGMGVNNVFASTTYGVNYTVAPLVGFSPPNGINLVTAAGSGYTAAPTVGVTGGTVVNSGTTTFNVTVNQGKVIAIYWTGTQTYSALPTITFTGGGGAGAAAAFPAGCLPTCTASLTAARQLNFTMTNSGFGYMSTATCNVGTTTATTAGGTFTTVASGITARMGAYQLTLNYFSPALTNAVQTDIAQIIPSNRKMQALLLSGNGMGLNLSSNLTLYGTAPLTLTASGEATRGNKLDLGGNTLLCTSNSYAGATATYNVGGSKAYVANGAITLTTRGGGTTGSTLTFPFAGNAASFSPGLSTGTGLGTTDGADILTVKMTENLSAPTNTSGTGLAFGNRSFTVNTATYGGGAGTAGTNPTVRLAYNSDIDPLVQTTALQNATFISEGTSSSGPWTLRQPAFGSTAVAMPAAGNLTTNTALSTPAATPVALANGRVYAWSAAAPAITSTSLDGSSTCANSGAIAINGTGFSGVTAVSIGGQPVLSFTVASNILINAVVGNAATGVATVTKLGGTASGSATITVAPSPSAPSLSQSSFTGTFGQTQAVTASGSSGTFNWYNVATGGVALTAGQSGANGQTYTIPACTTGGNYWVAENNGTCEGLRSQVSVTVSPAITASASPSFICANNTPVSLSTNVSGATYAWTSTRGTLSNATAGAPTLNSLTYTAEVNATISKNGCTASVPQISVGVYSFPSGIAPTATPSALCSGQQTTLATGLSAGNFTAVCATPAVGLATPPASAVSLINNGVTLTPLPSGVTNPSSSLDDGYFAGIPIGFNFNFFGNTATQVFIGTNGTIVMNVAGAAGSSSYTFTGGFPNAANPASTIAVCARDLRFGTPAGQGSLRYWTEGTAPNRRFVVQYNNVPTYSGGGVQNAEAVFYETLGQIDIRIISATDGTASYNKYIGLQDATRLIGATAPNCSSPYQQNYWNGITNVITSPLSWSFIPPKNYTFNWTNTANTTVGNAGTGQLSGAGTGLASPVSVTTTSTSQTPSATITYQVYIADPISGCSNVYSVPVTVTQTPPAPTTSYGASTPLVMCGTQVPNSGGALVSCPTCSGSQTYNWYTAATGGSLFQGSIAEDFNTGVNPGTFNLYNATGVAAGATGTNQAQLLNTRCELTQALASQYGALQLGSSGVNTNAYQIDFDLRVDQSDGTGGADGMSYSFGDTGVPTQEASMNAENGTGNKLKVGFVTYSNGTSTSGIYLMYNCTTNEQTPTTSGVLAYTSSTSWKNTTSDVHVSISINSSGQITLLVNGTDPSGTGAFTNVQLPVAYLASNKATWQHIFKARTGAAFSRCSIDNMVVNSIPVQSFPGIVQAVSSSASYFVQTLVGVCGSATRTQVSLQVDAPPAFAITASSTVCPYVYTPLTVTTGASNYTQFIWGPVGFGLLFNDAAGTQPYTGDSRSTVYVYSNTPGASLPAITCDALDTNGPVGNQCANTASSTFTVSAVPAAPVITASSLAPCNNTTITLSAAAAASYSTPSATSPTADEDLGQVRIGQLGSAIFDNTSATNSLVGTIGTATGTAGGYSNFTSFGPYTLNAANPVQFQLSSTTTGTFYTNMMGIFVDYNQDGDFADAGELAYVEPAGTSGPHTASGTFTIPGTALNGLTRMRVLCYEGTITASTLTSIGYGEWEDYAITITGAVSYTYAWTGGISATTISVTSLPITAPVSFSATVSQGTCYSAASNVISVAPSSAPSVTPTVVAFSAAYSTPSVSIPTSDEDIDRVLLRVDANGDTVYNAASGDYVLFNNTGIVNSLVGNIGTASGTQGSYSNFTNFGPYTLDATYQHNLVIRSTNTGTAYTNALAAWIDYNQDGDFVDANEQIVIGATTSGPHQRNVFFSVPVEAKNGITRLRVLCNEGAITGPTMSVFYGEWEDYALNIINATNAIPCPGSSALLNANVVGGGLPYASYAWTVNSGTATLSSASAATPSATVAADAAFSITVTDACGLTASGTTSVFNINENPIAVTPVNPTVCGNPGTTFTATGGTNYSWTPNDATAVLNTSTGAVVTAAPLATKTYTVSGEYGSGCIGTYSTTLTYTTPPVITITNDGPDQDINCGYGPVYQSTLHATSSASYTYTWANGTGNNAADTFTPGSNGFLNAADDSSFVVTLTAQEVGGAGCYRVSQRAVSVFPLPTPTMTATPAVVRLGTTSALASGVTQGNFSVTSCNQIPYAPITAPVNAVNLANGGTQSTALTSGSLDDGGWGAVPIGFTYNFFGSNFTSLNVGTNGVVQFGAYNGAALGDFTFSNPLPSPLEPTNIIALCAVDLYLATSGTVRYWVDGVAPNRKFVLEYVNVPGFITNGLQTVQLQLFETTGLFEIHLYQATSTSAKTIGVNNSTGTIGAAAPRCEGGVWNANTGTTTLNRAWRFTPPVDYTFAWSPAGQISGATTFGSATALPTTAGITGYQLLITDNVSGCSNAANPDSVYVTAIPVPSAPGAIGFGELSLTDGSANNIPFCGEQDVRAYVPAGSYPATLYGQTLTYEARWYLQAVGGSAAATTALGDTIIYGYLNDPAGLTADDTIWVSVYNGIGESARSQVIMDYQEPPAIAISNSSPLNCGPSSLTYSSTLVASSSNPSTYVYNWSSSASLDVTTGSTVVATFNNSVVVTLNANDGYCYKTIDTPISRYDFPAVVPTAANDSVCPGGTTTLNSNTSSTSFTISSSGYTPQSMNNATTLVQDAVAAVSLTTGGLDDGLWQNIPIGFTFDFLGNNYTTCAISTNGNVQFGPTFSTSYTPTFGAALPNNFIALFWTDLNFSNTTGNLIQYQTAGIAPNRVFSVKMDATRFGEDTKRLRGQIDFFETTGIVKVNIQSAAQGVTGAVASDVTIVGAEDLTGTIGSAVPSRNSGTWSVSTPEAWRFSPPVNYSFVWSPSSQISGSTTGTTATAAPTANTQYQLIVTDLNTGCDNSVNQQSFVTVNVASAPPVVNFSADDTSPSTGGVMQTVTFTTSTDEFGPSTYLWTFTPSTVTFVNGTSATSRNPQVQFEEVGSYDVSLVMTTCTGSGTKVRNSYINSYAEYCMPIFGTGDGFTGCNTGYGLGNVTILNPAGVTIMNHTGTGCISPASALGYANYSASPVNGVTTCTMYQGTTYQITTTSLNPANNEYFAAYLDVDNDGDFGDPLEFLGFNSTASATATFSLGIPTSNVIYGLHKMRIIGALGAGVLNATSSCIATTYGEAHDYVVNIQPPVILNDIPAFATNVIYSSNQVYPNSVTYSGNTTSATNSPESASTSNDIWYRFTAVGVGVSITMSSTTMDDRIMLYSRDVAGNYVLISDENVSTGTGDFERLNVGGLTPGQQYWISFGAAAAGQAGAFTFSISHLRTSWCSYAIPAGGFPLCNAFKAVFRGGASDGVNYAFNFLGTGSTPVGPTTATSSTTQIILSNPSLALRYGGTYNVRVDVTYTLATSNASLPPDVILATGSVADPNCTGVNIIPQPLLQVRSLQTCPAALFRGTFLGAVPVTVPACGAINYTFQFTPVNGGCGGTVSTGLPLTFTSASASPYLLLTALPLGANSGAWDVKIRPNFSYGLGTYGPTSRILVNSTAAGATLEQENADQDVKVESFIAANLYPNPNNGELVNLNVSGVESDNVFVRITDAMGRIVYTNRFAVEGSLNTIVTFAEPLASGIYNVEFTVDGEIMTERMIVAKQ